MCPSVGGEDLADGDAVLILHVGESVIRQNKNKNNHNDKQHTQRNKKR